MDDFLEDFFKRKAPAEIEPATNALPKNSARDTQSPSDIYSFSGGGKDSMHLIYEGKNGSREVLATVTFISTKNAAQEREIREDFLNKLCERLTSPEKAARPKLARHFDIVGTVINGNLFLYDVRHKDADNNDRQFATFLCQSKDEFRFFEPLRGAVGDIAHKRSRPMGLHSKPDELEL